jgi:hypothetical protein
MEDQRVSTANQRLSLIWRLSRTHWIGQFRKMEAGNINPSDAKTKADTLKGILNSVAPVDLR